MSTKGAGLKIYEQRSIRYKLGGYLGIKQIGKRIAIKIDQLFMHSAFKSIGTKISFSLYFFNSYYLLSDERSRAC